MKSWIRSNVNYSRHLCTRCRTMYWTHAILVAIIIGITSFASSVSGFLLHNSVSLEWQKCSRLDKVKMGRVPWVRAKDDAYDTDDDLTTTLEVSDDVLSRRQALGSLAISTATYFSMPPTAFAEELQSVGRRKSTKTAKAKSPSSSESSSFQESISGFVAGATLAGTKTLIKYPLDTATVRVQMPDSTYSIRYPFALFNGCFNGISLTLLSNIPAGAVFFGIKDAVKTAIKNSGDDDISTMPKWLSTSLAVGVALIPYWLVRNPSEVVKVRQQANIDGYGEDVSVIDAVKQTFKNSNEGNDKGKNISEFYTGYWENVLYAFPADVIKFVAYESITRGRKDLSAFEGAKAGALATALAQLITTPLDVIRNRLMTRKNGNDLSSEEKKKEGYVSALIKLGKEEGLSGLFAGATPRASKSILSGAIQFATYEETKQSMSKILLRN